MNAGDALQRDVRKVLLIQALLLLATAAIFMVAKGWFHAISALYGGVTAALITWWLGRQVRLAGNQLETDATRGSITLYGGVLKRYIVAAVLLAAGMGLIRLEPLPVVVGFAIAQTAFMFANLGNKDSN